MRRISTRSKSRPSSASPANTASSPASGTCPTPAGRGNIILLATRCTEPAQVEILIQSLAILAERQKSGAADYLDLKVLGRLPGATTASGTLEVPAPVDFVSWTDEVSAAARRDDLAPLPKTLVHTGTLSPAATAGFAAAHWKLEAVPYPTAP